MNARAVADSTIFRYGFLLLLLALLAFDLQALPGDLHSGMRAPFRGVFLSLALIINHVAFFCIPSGPAAKALRGFAGAWIVFVILYGFTPLLK
jgi:hypothetical protein